MSECVVICRTCRTANGRNPRRWDWLCSECAEECALEHRRDYPEHDIELRITSDYDVPAAKRLARDIERYHQLTGGLRK